MSLLLAGTGAMASEYAKVLSALGVPFTAVGRGQRSAAQFAKLTGIAPATGGVVSWLKSRRAEIATAIVAVTGDQLAPVTMALLGQGVRRILVEKPAGIDSNQIQSVAKRAGEAGADVRVAYNRRFYGSVQRAREIIAVDGRATSIHFEFTEWASRVANQEHAPGILENWFLANSTHVIDTAFFLCGMPAELASYTGGGLPWHRHSVYAGAGVTRSGALFSYHANWEAPGRWGIEVMTTRHHLVLRPMETLSTQEFGKTDFRAVGTEDELDTRYKPGLYRQTEAFLARSVDGPPSIAEHVEHLYWYERINGARG
jgi:predicted dehydrogenase